MNGLPGAVMLEVRVQARYGILPMAAGLTAVWTAVLLAVPAQVAAVAAPFLLLVDTATFGALLLAGLLLFERAEGARAALAASPLTPGAYLTAKVGLLTGLSVASAVPIALAGARGAGAPPTTVLPPVVAGVALATVFFLALVAAAVAATGDLMRFLAFAPAAMAPCIALPLAYLAGALEHPAVFAVPTTAAAELMRAGTSGVQAPAGPLAAGLVLLVTCCALLAVLARHLVDREPVEGAPSREPAPSTAAAHRGLRPAARRRPRGGAWAALALIDLRGAGRDLLVIVLVAAPLLLALALRYGYPLAEGFLAARHGLALAEHRPLVFAVMVLLHVPLMVASAVALKLVEDIDDGALRIIQVTPVSLGGYLGFRLGLAFTASLAGLAVAVPLSGLSPGWGSGLLLAVVLAAAQAPLFVLVVTAVARNKVEALTALKGLGLVMLVPLPLWFLPGAWPWLLAWLPPVWPVMLAWGWAGPWWGAAAGLALSAGGVALLLGRVGRR